MNRQPLSTESENKKSLVERGRNRLYATGAIAAIGVAALTGCSTDTDAQPKPEVTQSTEAPVPVVTTEPTPVETEVPIPEVELPAPETLRLSGELPPEQLVEGAYKLMSDWTLAGATADTIKATDEAFYAYNDGDYESFKAEVAQKNADYYSVALFEDNWQEDPNTTRNYEANIANNIAFLGAGLKRITNNEPMIEHEFTISNVNEMIGGRDAQRLIEFDIDEKYINNDSMPSQSTTALFRFEVVEDGTARLVEYTIEPRQ